MSWLLSLLRSFKALWVAKEVGASDQRSADQQATVKVEHDDLQDRAVVDAKVSAMSDNELDQQLRQFTKPSD